jgi:serine protease Do
MTGFSLKNTRSARKRMMASVAALALVASGAIGGAVLAPPTGAQAAQVVTSDLQQPALPSLSPLVSRIKPAVVAIKVTMENVSAPGEGIQGMRGMPGQFDNLPPEIQQFFKRFGQENGGGGMRAPQARPVMAQGSGFFISADGYVVTNNHVVQNAKSVTVVTDGGKSLHANVIGTDPKTDLALLKVTEPGDYPFVALAKESPRVGDWVVAIGNPFGLGGTVTAGIVSADGRDIGSGPYDNYLQIDAPINKGNSGGPTFNMKGEVVGVNTAIFSPSGGSVGLAFAIPASTVGTVVNALEHGGVVSRGYLGVRIQPVSQDIADSLGLPNARGALIDQAEADTPAAKAGLKAGDIVTQVNGQEIKDARDLARQVGMMKPGDEAQVTYWRDGKTQTAAVKLGTQAPDRAVTADASRGDRAPSFGLQLAPAGQVAGMGDKGVVVVGVDPNGVAASKGVKDGDVILEVAGKPVDQPGQVVSAVNAARQEGKKAVLLKLKTADGSRYVALGFPQS